MPADPRDQIAADVEAFARERRVTILFDKPETGELKVSWLYADHPGEGAGTAVMKRLTQRCDEQGVTLTLVPARCPQRRVLCALRFHRERKPGSPDDPAPFGVDNRV